MFTKWSILIYIPDHLDVVPYSGQLTLRKIIDILSKFLRSLSFKMVSSVETALGWRRRPGESYLRINSTLVPVASY